MHALGTLLTLIMLAPWGGPGNTPFDVSPHLTFYTHGMTIQSDRVPSSVMFGHPYGFGIQLAGLSEFNSKMGSTTIGAKTDVDADSPKQLQSALQAWLKKSYGKRLVNSRVRVQKFDTTTGCSVCQLTLTVKTQGAQRFEIPRGPAAGGAAVTPDPQTPEDYQGDPHVFERREHHVLIFSPQKLRIVYFVLRGPKSLMDKHKTRVRRILRTASVAEYPRPR